ncbi:hypothetical protein Tco_1289840 [Tanacetum coccineum]
MFAMTSASNASNLPPLAPDQILKLRQLTVLTLAETNKVPNYEQFLPSAKLEPLGTISTMFEKLGHNTRLQEEGATFKRITDSEFADKELMDFAIDVIGCTVQDFDVQKMNFMFSPHG